MVLEELNLRQMKKDASMFLIEHKFKLTVS